MNKGLNNRGKTSLNKNILFVWIKDLVKTEGKQRCGRINFWSKRAKIKSKKWNKNKTLFKYWN